MNFTIFTQDFSKKEERESFSSTLKEDYPTNELPSVTYSMDSRGFMVARGQGFQGNPPKSNTSFQINDERKDSYGSYNNEILDRISKNLQSLEKALQELEEGKKKNPIYYPYLYNLGRVYSLLGKHEEAIREFENANRIFEYYQNFIQMGFIYESRLQFRKAENSYRQALRLNPVSGEVQYYLCSLSVKGNASSVYRELLNFSGDDPELEFYSKLCIAEKFQKSGKSGRAFDLLKKIKTNFNNIGYHILMGDLALEMNQRDLAISEYEKALDSPFHPIFLQISFSVLNKKVNYLKNLK